ncbi:MAG: BMP family ABC transporter substrate-binding protein [Oscillospiraceae bacterium]|nr:BMP family ABC transporter substrate-binding protein [Oscillospiraceae bacterium]
MSNNDPTPVQPGKTWICPACETENQGTFCVCCGVSREEAAAVERRKQREAMQQGANPQGGANQQGANQQGANQQGANQQSANRQKSYAQAATEQKPTPAEPPAAKPKSKAVPILIAALVVVLLVAGGVIFFLLNRDKDDDDDRRSGKKSDTESSVSIGLSQSESTADDSVTTAGPATVSADSIPDEMTAPDGVYKIAFITDTGSLKDLSYNQFTYDGVKLYAHDIGLTYKYYIPANGDWATDNDRYNAMKAAVDNGAEVIVCSGFMQAGALEKAAKEFTNVKFIFIDGWDLGYDNVAPVIFREEQAGFLAGYAAVMEGYTRLGFCGAGGGMNPAVNRYGYGYVQGAEAAAAVKNVQVDIKYSFLYGSSFSASPELESLAKSWYSSGTEVIFVCGGSMFQSVTAAASATGGKVIGVDVDQSFSSDTVLTSAAKRLDMATGNALDMFYGHHWNDLRSASGLMGATQNAVGLPTATWSLRNWTVQQYEDVLDQLARGEITVDSDWSNLKSTAHVTIDLIE